MIMSTQKESVHFLRLPKLMYYQMGAHPPPIQKLGHGDVLCVCDNVVCERAVYERVVCDVCVTTLRACVAVLCVEELCVCVKCCV